MTRQRSINFRNITVTNRWWITIFLFSGRVLLHDIISGRAFRVSLSPSSSLSQSSSPSFSIQSLHLVAGSKYSSDIFPTIKSAPFRLFSSSSSSSSSSPEYSATSGHNKNTREKSTMATGYLNAVDAAALDVELMSTPGFSLEQLMELAGLAVAEGVFQGIPSLSDSTKKRKILIVCGPGNNGGDGLVAARHLYFFSHYDCVIVYPKRSKKDHFLNLVKQCEDVDIPILDEMPTDIDSYDAIVDAIFGFSFQGEPREPFASILHQLIDVQQQQQQQRQQQSDQSDDQIKKDVQIISVDVPSGWNVDEGDMAGLGFVPDILISLTAPKLCSKQFTGRHYIGGRFLPPKMAKKYNIQVRNKQVRSILYIITSYIYYRYADL